MAREKMQSIFLRIGERFKQLKTWQKSLIIGLLVVIIVAVGFGSYVISKLGMMNRIEINDGELSCVDVDGYVNILLLGVDTRDMSKIEGAGADAIMILSIKEDTGDVKLMSVYRDTYLKVGDEAYFDKITNANRVGGPELMMKTLNQAMDLNINKFAVVNFKSVADLVDAVGGITVDVEDYEIQQLNKYTKQTAKNIGKKEYQLVEKAGEQTLEGVQAVSYGRIRKGVGDDYKRTERMRIVITKVFEKVKTMSVVELNDILNLMMPQVQTNLNNNDIFVLAARLMQFNIHSGAGWPYDVTSGLVDGVSYVFPNDLYTNTKELHLRMFGQEDYEPTDLVVSMSNQIIQDISSSAEETKDIDTRQEDKEAEDKEEKAEKKNDDSKGNVDKDEVSDKADKEDDSVNEDEEVEKKDEGPLKEQETQDDDSGQETEEKDDVESDETKEPEETTNSEETEEPDSAADTEDTSDSVEESEENGDKAESGEEAETDVNLEENQPENKKDE